MKLRGAAIAAALSLLPFAASALTVDPSSTITSGNTYDIGNGPFFWGASFDGGDSAGMVSFRFENSNPGAVDVSGDVLGTVLQFTGAFEYLKAAWKYGDK